MVKLKEWIEIHESLDKPFHGHKKLNIYDLKTETSHSNNDFKNNFKSVSNNFKNNFKSIIGQNM